MSINLQTGAYVSSPTLPGARSTDIQVAQKQPEQSPVPSLPLPGESSANTVPSADEVRYERVLQSAQRIAGNPYPVSDKTFSIYKDSTGQYITRYVSLRDGRVTYIPELKQLQQFEAAQRAVAKPALVEIQA